MKRKEIVEKMTLEEKAAILSGKTVWQTREIPRLGVPSLFCADGPHGIRKQAGAGDHLGLNASLPATCFPTAATVANSWDTELARELGKALGEEASAQDVQVLLGPGLNIKRSPLCGRNFEYFSEDPLLGGSMAAAITKGVQSCNGVGTTIKHFACNNQEDNRMGCDSIVSERALREIYLRGFEIAVKTAQPMAIMTSYNLINGVHTANSKDLCTVAAREEWNFQGIIMTDWTTTMPRGGSSAWGCIAAGNDLIMPGCEGDKESILKALAEGTLDREELKACVKRMLRVIFQTNAYEASVPYEAGR